MNKRGLICKLKRWSTLEYDGIFQREYLVIVLQEHLW